MSKQKAFGAEALAEIGKTFAAKPPEPAPAPAAPPKPKPKRGRWVSVSGPKIWRPDREGEELTGTYLGTKTLVGHYGPYQVAVVARQVNETDVGVVTYVPGVVAVTILEAVPLQSKVRLTYRGAVYPHDPSRNPYRNYTAEMWVAT